MTNRGSKATATGAGLALTMTAVGAGVGSSSGFALLLSFAGVLVGSSFIFVGVHVAEDRTAPIGRPGVLAAGVRVGALVLVHWLRRNLSLVGLLLASAAASVTATAAAAGREVAPVVCFCAFALLMLAISLLNIGLLLLGEQEH